MPEDMYWTLSQLVNRRANLKTHHIRLKNQLHEQVCVAYPSYKQFFQDIGRPTALYFWKHYPSPRLLRGKKVEELAEELIPVSHNQFSTRKCQKILDAVKSDGDTTRDYQTERDEITKDLVRDVRHYVTQLEEVDKAIADFLPRFECTLNTIPGVSDTTVAKMLSEIGDIRRFLNANKLANFAGNDIFPCYSDDSVIIQGLAEESGFLLLLSEAVDKGKDQATGFDINFL